MKPQAVVLVVDELGSPPFTLSNRLAALGYAVRRASSDGAVAGEAIVTAPDAVLICAEGPPARAAAAVAALKSDPKTSDLPVVMVSPRAAAAARAEALAAGADDVLPFPFSDTELSVRLNAVTRLHTMQVELARRHRIALAYGADVHAPSAEQADSGDPRILLVGSAMADAQMISLALAPGAAVTLAPDRASALAMLLRRPFDLAVVCAEPDQADSLAFAIDVRRDPRLYNLPIVMLAGLDPDSEPEEPFRAGINDVLMRPLVPSEVAARLSFLVRQQRLRVFMQGAYRQSQHTVTSDGLTGLYNHGFAHDYLNDLIVNSRWERNLTVAVLDIHHLASINREIGFSAGDAILRQAGWLIGNLVRGEDLSARIGGDDFCLILPDTAPNVGEIAVRRLCSVVGYTEFAVPGHEHPVRVLLKAGCAGLRHGDSAERVIARARNNMNNPGRLRLTRR